MKKREFLKTGIFAAGGIGLSLSGVSSLSAAVKSAAPKAPVYAAGAKLNKRELVLAALDLSKPNKYVPAGFFLHFKDKFGPNAIQSHLDFFRATNMDFAKIQYEIKVPKLTNIKTPKDWVNIPVYGKEVFDPQFDVNKTIAKELKAEALILPTVYSPFSLAVQSVGLDTLKAHAKEDPDAVAKGIEKIVQSILYYIRESIKLGVDGFYISSQGGDVKNFDDGPLFDKLIAPFDKAVLTEASNISLVNILHICDYGSTYKSLKPFVSYPGSIINPPIKLSDGSDVHAKDVQALFGRPVFGGLDRLGTIATGSPEAIKKEIDAVLKDASPNFLLGADCTVDGGTPHQNLRAAIDYAHDWRINNG